MKHLCPLFLSLFCLTLMLAPQARAYTGQSGYLLNGKLVVTHQDGKPLVEEEASTPPTNNRKRNPAATYTTRPSQGVLQFDEDNLARCYWLPNQSSLQCIKK